MAAGHPFKQAWPGGHIVTSNKRARLQSLLQRQTGPPTLHQLTVAAGFGLDGNGAELLKSCLSKNPRHSLAAATSAPRVKRTATAVHFCETKSVRPFRVFIAEKEKPTLFSSTAEYNSAKADRVNDMPPIAAVSQGLATVSDAHNRAVEFQRQLIDEPMQSHVLMPGSSRPHSVDGGRPDAQRIDRWAPAGSLRQLDVESDEVLKNEPLPLCNVPTRTEPEDPPPRLVGVPGPFTTLELIPSSAIAAVEAHGSKIKDMLRRAKRATQGAHVARRLRPDALILQKHEALNPCGWGFTWRKRTDEDLWDVVQPSSQSDPPNSSFNGEVFAADAKKLGMDDKQVVSWGLHGFPGAVNMPNDVAVIGYPHAGAIKNAAALEDMNQRDIDNGFVTHGSSFPEIWPCVCDPMNIVVQHDKPRATIDKTMRLSSASHPEKVKSYNDYIDLERERAVVPFKLVRVWQLSRAAAILMTAGVEVELGKFDLSTYFRIHGKQRAHVYQSGRILETLFGFDLRINFGERDAPDHTGRASDALAFFVRTELRRLGGEYPSRCSRIVEWLAMRTGLARDAGDFEDPTFIWACLFFFLYYVDDAGLASFADLLVDKRGAPVMVLVPDGNGDLIARQQRRSEMYFNAAMEIVRRFGHDTPLKKQSPMGFRLDFLGTLLDGRQRKRLLTHDKRTSYLALVVVVLASPKNPNGTRVAKYDSLNSLVHKLLHASEVVPIGRAHLFYTRKAIKAAKEAGDERISVFLGDKPVVELEWWHAQLSDAASCERHGVPFAVRFGFPTGAPGTIIHYGDASRELGNVLESGFGAWAVIADVFVFIEGRWTEDEIKHYSINVLEAFVKDVATYRFYEFACEFDVTPTHSLAYCDNSTAESIAEFGRTTKEGLHALNARRQHWLLEHGVHQSTERVASIHNDVADLISRGKVKEALRFPESHGITVRKLLLSESQRDTSFIPPTWC